MDKTENQNIKNICLLSKYKKLTQFISEHNLIYECKNCKSFLFHKDDIESITLIDNKKLSYILLVEDGASFLPIKDEIKKKDDLIYYKISCKSCNNITGRFIIGTNQQNIIFRDKLHIDSNEVITFLIDNKISMYVNLKELTKENNTNNVTKENNMTCIGNNYESDFYKNINKNIEALILNTNNIFNISDYFMEFNVIKEALVSLKEIIDYTRLIKNAE